jgi:hypothetical protein
VFREPFSQPTSEIAVLFGAPHVRMQVALSNQNRCRVDRRMRAEHTFDLTRLDPVPTDLDLPI